MAEEVVKIVVEQESRGSALKDAATDAEKLKRQAKSEAAAEHPELVNEIKRYRELGDKYKETDATRSRSYYADANAKERELNGHAKERLQHYKGLAEEARKVGAVERARESYLGRVGRAAGGLAEQAAGGTPFGGALSSIGGGGAAGATAAVAAAVVTAVMATEAARNRNMTLLGLSNETAQARDARHARRMADFEGDAGSNAAAARESGDRVQDIEKERAEAQTAAKPVWYKPNEFGRWFSNLFSDDQMNSVEGEAKIKQLNDEQSREASNKARFEQNTKKKFGEEQAPLIQAEEKRLDNDLRGARVLEQQVMWTRERNRLRKEGAEEWQAQEGASLKVAEAQRVEAQRYAGLVTARDGARDVARMAQFAQGARGGGGHGDQRVTSAIEKMHADMNARHEEAMRATAPRGNRRWWQ